MPKVTRWFIKSGMVYFLLALVLAVIIAMPRTDIGSVGLPVLHPVLWHALVVGWITQIIMGVSIWMFPGGARREGVDSMSWSWLAFWCLNTGLLLRMGIEPFLGTRIVSGYLDVGLVLSAILQLLGGLFYVMEIWPRVMSKQKSISKRRS